MSHTGRKGKKPSKRPVDPKAGTGNQYVADPRQALFLSSYLDPKSKTFGNAYQSAKLAKYSEEYALNIMGVMPEWLAENIGRAKMVEKAERNLDEFLDMETTSDKYAKEIGIYTESDSAKLKVKADISKFVAERLHRNKYGKAEVEVNLNTNIVNIEKALIQLANDKQDKTTRSNAVQEGKRRTDDPNGRPVSDIRHDIQEILSESSPDVSHEIREESSGSSSSSNESGDVS